MMAGGAEKEGTHKGVSHVWVANPDENAGIRQAWVTKCGNPFLTTSEPPAHNSEGNEEYSKCDGCYAA